jgi:hypothetical protein
MAKHYIYEIFGRKIGCTNNIPVRMKRQGIKEGEYRIIEEHTNAKVASVRERELQKEHGYPVDRIEYWKTLKNAKKAHTPEGQAKRVKNTDYQARTTKIDYKVIVAKIDWKASRAKIEKPVNQYNLEGTFIKKYKSINEAVKSINGFASGISRCCNGKQEISSGYKWKYAN